MKPNEKLSDEQIEKIKGFINFLIDSGIRLLCLDYDLTICAIHTRGTFVTKDTMRPVFKEFFKAARETELKVCVTTYHPLVDDVREEITREMGIDKMSVLVRSQTNTEGVNAMLFSLAGKTPMIESAWKALFESEEAGDEVDFAKCFLIDDDLNNIIKARGKKCPGFWFNPVVTEVETFLENLLPKEEETLERYTKAPVMPKHTPAPPPPKKKKCSIM